jgi:hypothetical protein
MSAQESSATTLPGPRAEAICTDLLSAPTRIEEANHDEDRDAFVPRMITPVTHFSRFHHRWCNAKKIVCANVKEQLQATSNVLLSGPF